MAIFSLPRQSAGMPDMSCVELEDAGEDCIDCD
jgi:hypothetical protein